METVWKTTYDKKLLSYIYRIWNTTCKDENSQTQILKHTVIYTETRKKRLKEGGDKLGTFTFDLCKYL